MADVVLDYSAISTSDLLTMQENRKKKWEESLSKLHAFSVPKNFHNSKMSTEGIIPFDRKETGTEQGPKLTILDTNWTLTINSDRNSQRSRKQSLFYLYLEGSDSHMNLKISKSAIILVLLLEMCLEPWEFPKSPIPNLGSQTPGKPLINIIYQTTEILELFYFQ